MLHPAGKGRVYTITGRGECSRKKRSEIRSDSSFFFAGRDLRQCDWEFALLGSPGAAREDKLLELRACSPESGTSSECHTAISTGMTQHRHQVERSTRHVRGETEPKCVRKRSKMDVEVAKSHQKRKFKIGSHDRIQWPQPATGTGVAGHLIQSLPYPFPCQVLITVASCLGAPLLTCTVPQCNECGDTGQRGHQSRA